MYFRKPKGILKHWDFVLLDLACLHLALFTAYYIRHGNFEYWKDETYITLSLVMTILTLLVCYFSETFRNVFKRGLYRELVQTVEQISLVFLMTVFFLYFAKIGQEVSRLTIFYCAIIYLCITYPTRLIHKKLMLNRMGQKVC